MKKKILLLSLTFLLGWGQSFAQAVNEPANWPNTNWSISGTFSAPDLLADPTIDPNFSYDDDGAGGGSIDSISVISNVIDLTPAQIAGENFIFVNGEYAFNEFTTNADLFELQYWDADLGQWVTWQPFTENSTAFSAWCSELTGATITSLPIDISAFTANQLINFQYRAVYDASDEWSYGFCMSSPTLYSSGCLPVTGLTSSNVTTTTVDLSWTPQGSETMWNIEYGPLGFTPGIGNGTIVPVTSTNETVPSLTPNTTYDFYVQANCGGGDESTWFGPVTVTTLCDAFTAPWNEGFENGGAIPDCWSQGATNGEDWEFANSGFGHIGNNGTIIGNTATDNYFAWVDDSSPSSIGTTLLSPFIDVTPLTSPMLEFYRLSDNEGETNVDFSVDVWDGSAWNLDVYSSNSNSANGAWEYIFVDISGLTFTGDVQLRFVVDENNGADFDDDLAIDDVGIVEAPTCLQPTALTISDVTGSTVDLTWTPGGTETLWNVEYGPAGFIQGTGTVLSAATPTDFPVAGLNPTTAYDFYVQADCGGGDESFWAGPISAQTLIASVNCISGQNTFLMDTEFENGIPASWTNTATGDPQWEIGTGSTPSTNTGPSGAFSGAEYLFLETSGGSAGDADTLKGSADLSTGLNEAKMYFYYHMYGSDMGELIVEVSDDGGTTWTNEFSQVGQDQTIETDPWTPVEIDLTPYLGSLLDYRIIGVRGSGFRSDMSIDLFRIETCVSCPQPTALNVSNINPTSADLDWLAGFAETEWIIEYDTSNFVLGTGNTMVTTNNPETLSGLMENTSYDVYIRAICGIGDTSVYSGPLQFSTPCTVFSAPYQENFDGSAWVPGTGFNNADSEISGCWSRNPDAVDFFWGTRTGTTGAFASGPETDASGSGNYVYTEGSNGGNGDTARIVSPTIDLSTVIDPYLGFSYHMYGNSIDSLTVEISNDNGMTWDTIVNIYGEQQADNTDAWKDTSVALTAYSSDNVMIRFMQIKSGTNSDIAIDEFSILPCIGSAGQDGSVDVCRFDTLVDLNTAITADQDGMWSFPLDQDLIVNGSDLNVLLLPAGDYEVYYIAPGACENDTAVATINVFNGSNAGSNGSLEVCQNEPVNLFDGLNGNVDLGGTWLDPSNNPITGSQPVASSVPGSYNYDYITSNGVCPADTSLVEVIVRSDCDHLSLGNEKLNELSVFPNPATNAINIANPSNSESLRVEILDLNGRVVLTDAKALANATEATIDISHLVKGMYTLRVYNGDGQKTFKIVKQ